MATMINFNTPPTPTPKPKPAKDGWGKWYNTTHKTKTFAEQHEINSQETLQHTTNNLTPINVTDHYNNHLSEQLEQQLEQQENQTTNTLYIALHNTEQALETIHALQRNIRKLIEQHLQQQ